ncbi:hypothetical protein C6I20_04025 [Aeromicrobium sp. A1-2]|uniref:enoyl-CoA hydratase/isomerase family protein n=1 Tax=Aeromicrobium sp. A1-2 TaxID=2107713 RepID=UPI000E50AEDE|nr:enoyl-CoA hydratase/isomerase family protein [Aeromicrobium sp. A1-2]AXT84443.1 hypothetical protein C6I20_04025 [Aeromicrobium sp. A1-2]
MSVLIEVSDGIAVITIDRPSKLNAMDPDAYEAIGEAFLRIENDPDILVGIVTGVGHKAFSAGADLKEMHSDRPDDAGWEPWRPTRWDFGLGTSKPLIAAVNGYALAGGLELALVCDIRIASSSAVFGAPEVKWDLLDGYGAYRLPRVVGLSNAMDLLLTGRFIDAEEALRIGLVSQIVEGGALMQHAQEIAQTICANGSLAVRMTKELVQRGLDSSVEAHFRLMHMFYDRIDGSDSQRERLDSFASKRPSGRPSTSIPDQPNSLTEGSR